MKSRIDELNELLKASWEETNRELDTLLSVDEVDSIKGLISNIIKYEIEKHDILKK